MRVELIDPMGQSSVITSTDPELIGAWFAEQAPRHMSADARCTSRIQIWTQTREEFDVVGQQRNMFPFTQEGLLELAEMILDAATKQGELEATRT